VSKVHLPPEESEDLDIATYAIDRWGRTARLCAIRLAEGIATPLGALLLWMCSRR
jgi:hypothetical protein